MFVFPVRASPDPMFVVYVIVPPIVGQSLQEVCPVTS